MAFALLPLLSDVFSMGTPLKTRRLEPIRKKGNHASKYFFHFCGGSCFPVRFFWGICFQELFLDHFCAWHVSCERKLEVACVA